MQQLSCRPRSYIALLAGVLLVSVLAAPGFGGNAPHSQAGTTGGTFLKIGVGARPIGMGGAFVAVANDASSLYWNPAGLMNFSGTQLAVMHNKWVEGVNYEFLGFAYADSGETGFAFGLNYLWMGDIPVTTFNDKLGSSGDTFTARDLALVFGYSHRVADGVFVGGTAKSIRSTLDDISATATAFDAGVLLFPPLPGATVGFTVQNAGTKLTFVKDGDRLPLTYKGGVAYRFRRSLTVACDVSKPIDHFVRVNAGAEFILLGTLALRGGYNSSNELDHGFSAGTGLTVKYVTVDYAFVPYGVLGNTHRVSAVFKF